MKGAKGRPTYAIFVVKLSKAYLHGVKAVLMEAIQSVFEHGMLEIRFAQLAVDIIANTNEIKVNAETLLRSQLIYSVFYIFKEFNNIYMSAPYQQFVFWTINLIIRFSIMNVFEILLNNITNRTGLDSVKLTHTILYIYYKFLVSWSIRKSLTGFENLFNKSLMQGFLKYGRN